MLKVSVKKPAALFVSVLMGVGMLAATAAMPVSADTISTVESFTITPGSVAPAIANPSSPTTTELNTWDNQQYVTVGLTFSNNVYSSTSNVSSDFNVYLNSTQLSTSSGTVLYAASVLSGTNEVLVTLYSNALTNSYPNPESSMMGSFFAIKAGKLTIQPVGVTGDPTALPDIYSDNGLTTHATLSTSTSTGFYNKQIPTGLKIANSFSVVGGTPTDVVTIDGTAPSTSTSTSTTFTPSNNPLASVRGMANIELQHNTGSGWVTVGTASIHCHTFEKAILGVIPTTSSYTGGNYYLSQFTSPSGSYTYTFAAGAGNYGTLTVTGPAADTNIRLVVVQDVSGTIS